MEANYTPVVRNTAAAGLGKTKGEKKRGLEKMNAGDETGLYCFRVVLRPLAVRPFLIQSDSASRERPFSTGLFLDWILLVLVLIVSRVDFIVFVLFLEAAGVREHCCTAGEIGTAVQQAKSVGSSVLSAFSASNLEPSSQRVGGFELSESRRSYVRGVALSREPPKLQQAQPLLAAWDRDCALLSSCDFFFFFFFLTLLLSSFWASRGHRCLPFSPPVLAFNFYRA